MAFFVSSNMHKRPQNLQSGDQVIIIAPAGRIKDDGLNNALSQLSSWGLKVTIADHAEEGYDYFSAPDLNRLMDLQNAIDSSIYKAVFCARGGYGLTRIIDEVDFSALKKHPKWFIGFSDITALHLALSSHGLQSIHSVMPTGFELADQVTIDSLRETLFGEHQKIDAPYNLCNKNGKVEAPMIGGNLSILSSCIGTKYELDTAGRILFIEEVDEYLYKIDRMLGQLNRSGKLKNLKGLVIGHMSQMKDTSNPFGNDIYELILDHVLPYGYPVLFDVPIGHDSFNLSIIQEANYIMEVTEVGGQITLSNNKTSN